MSDEVDQHVLHKYEIVQRIGRGAYGVVWKAVCRKTGQKVALKKCFDAFQSSTDAQRTFREIMYLQALQGHDNIIQIRNVLKADNDRDMYIVTDFMESDLHAVIKAGILEEVHKQFIVYQLLRALKYMHSGQLIHRDIKPSNVVLNSDCIVKFCDFGLARSVSASSFPDPPTPMTEYIATRWYRAPEILLGCPRYSTGVDIWAVGCILGELLSGKPLFPGTSTLDQVDRVVSATGYPSSADLASLKSARGISLLESIDSKRAPALRSMFPRHDVLAVDFLSQCLQFNAEKRPSAAQLLKHPWLALFHDPDFEPNCPNVINGLDDDTRLTTAEYRRRLYEEVARRKEANREAAKLKLPEPKPTFLQFLFQPDQWS